MVEVLNDIPGLICISLFTLVFILISIWATRKKRIEDKYSSVPKDERFLIGGREIDWFLGSCSLTGLLLHNS